jgi:hypothetical protein
LKEYPNAKIIILKQPKSNLSELDRIEGLLWEEQKLNSYF